MKLDISSYSKALNALRTLEYKQYWDSTEKRAFFIGAGKKQKDKKWVDSLIKALQLYSEEAVTKARKELKK